MIKSPILNILIQHPVLQVFNYLAGSKWVGDIPGTEEENRPIIFVNEHRVMRRLYKERAYFFCIYFMEGNMDFCTDILFRDG